MYVGFLRYKIYTHVDCKSSWVQAIMLLNCIFLKKEYNFVQLFLSRQFVSFVQIVQIS